MKSDRPKMPRPMAIADLLGGTFSDNPLGERLREGKIWLVWESAVGAQIAAKARPVAFRNSTLVIEVTNAPWLQQLNFLKRDMVEKLNSRLGSDLIRDIQLRAGTRQQSAAATQRPKSKSRNLSPADNRQIEKQAGHIDDAELRDIFSGLLKKHLSNDPE
jgi:hypothetical protein